MIEFKFEPFTSWPRPDTPNAQRRSNIFKNHAGAITFDRTMRDLREELRRLGVEQAVVIQTAHRDRDIRNDGLPRGDAPRPSHPGVILSFNGRHGPLKYMCDHFRDWVNNVRAISLTLERLRLIDLYGVTSRGEQYTGWRALPAPLVTAPPMTIDEAANFLHQRGQDTVKKLLGNFDAYRSAYRNVATQLHPDPNAGKVHPDWNKLQDAKRVLDQHHQAKETHQ